MRVTPMITPDTLSNEQDRMRERVRLSDWNEGIGGAEVAVERHNGGRGNPAPLLDARHKTWYKHLLMEVIDGKKEFNPRQWSALQQYARLMGWNKPRKNKKSNKSHSAPKPDVSPDLQSRL